VYQSTCGANILFVSSHCYSSVCVVKAVIRSDYRAIVAHQESAHAVHLRPWSIRVSARGHQHRTHFYYILLQSRLISQNQSTIANQNLISSVLPP